MSIQWSNELYHYGMPRRSGRYKWGSGKNPYHHGQSTSTGKQKKQAIKDAKKERRKAYNKYVGTSYLHTPATIRLAFANKSVGGRFGHTRPMTKTPNARTKYGQKVNEKLKDRWNATHKADVKVAAAKKDYNEYKKTTEYKERRKQIAKRVAIGVGVTAAVAATAYVAKNPQKVSEFRRKFKPDLVDTSHIRSELKGSPNFKTKITNHGRTIKVTPVNNVDKIIKKGGGGTTKSINIRRYSPVTKRALGSERTVKTRTLSQRTGHGYNVKEVGRPGKFVWRNAPQYRRNVENSRKHVSTLPSKYKYKKKK